MERMILNSASAVRRACLAVQEMAFFALVAALLVLLPMMFNSHGKLAACLVVASLLLNTPAVLAYLMCDNRK